VTQTSRTRDIATAEVSPLQTLMGVVLFMGDIYLHTHCKDGYRLNIRYS